MKRRVLAIGLVVLILSLVVGLSGWTVGAQEGEPPLEEQIEAAIVNGLRWLIEDAPQPGDGSWGWGGSCDRVARTGLVVLKLETRAIELDLDPLGEEYEYSARCADGLAYILANRHDQDVSPGEPDGNGNGKRVYFTDCHHEIYNTGIAMMALAASGHLELYEDNLQDAVDYMAWAQADPDCDSHRGGWRYGGDVCDSDNSNAGYVTLGLGYAEYPAPYGFDLTIPQFVKDELSIWIDAIQDDVDHDPPSGDDGGSSYTPHGSWVNELKTGNLVFEMTFVGDLDDPQNPSQRFLDALDYIERHWQDENTDPGWGYNVYPAGYQAMFTLMKGFEYSGIDLIDLDGDGTPEHDWFQEFATVLVDQQHEGGSWPGWCHWGDDVLCTTWALLTLEKAVPERVLSVYVDIKPGSCPNPFNIKTKGVLPVAVLGTEDFDVTTIDPATIQLTREGYEVGVSPLRWSYEDVATPFEGELCECHDLNGDGYMDLTLKFKTQEVKDTLELEVEAGNTVPLLVTGNLKEEDGETPIVGSDCIWVLQTDKKK